MAIYSTFFLARPDQLASGFPGWKPPLPAPVRREFRNPFTKQLVVVETREPEWSQELQSPAISQFRAVRIEGSFEAYLEGRLPQFVRESEHWAAKGLTEVELEPLLRAIGASTNLESPIYAPPPSGAVLRELPSHFSSQLAENDLGDIARRWAAEMSAPEHTHSVSGKKLNDGWTAQQAMQILTPIVSLAGRASAGQRLYLLIEA